MAVALNPYLNFPGTAREAMEFYRGIFGGDLSISTFGEFGSTDAGVADKIMHSHLKADAGFTFMGADLPPEMPHQPGHTISMTLSGDNGDELRGYWAQLTEGGTVSVPLEKQMWGDEFGMCVDRFGIQWMVNIGQPQS